MNALPLKEKQTKSSPLHPEAGVNIWLLSEVTTEAFASERIPLRPWHLRRGGRGVRLWSCLPEACCLSELNKMAAAI